jgi:hypothetical protein
MPFSEFLFPALVGYSGTIAGKEEIASAVRTPPKALSGAAISSPQQSSAFQLTRPIRKASVRFSRYL